MRSGLSLLGSASLTHRLGRVGSAGLLYSYTRDPAVPGLLGRHRLSANFVYAPSERCNIRMFGTHTLDTTLSSTFADASYQIGRGWRLSFLQTMQKYAQYSYSDTELALGREIGNNELRLVWSRSRGKLRFEFTAGRF